MALSAIIPATDAPPTLAQCVAALRAALPPEGEVIVVGEPEGAGPAAARNAGAERAGGDVLVFVDADVVVEEDALARIAARFAEEPELAALFGCYDDQPAAPGAVSRFRNLLHHHVHASAPGPAETFWAGLGAVRRDVFREVGGFDAERYPRASIEDVELGVRLRERGARIELDPAIRGKHLKRWTVRTMVATDLLRRGAPWVELQLERRPPRTLNLAWRHRIAAVAAAGAVAAAMRRRPAAAGLLALTMVLANARLYVLLARRGGGRLALAGVLLHALHHVTALVSVPVGAARRAGARRG